MTITLLTGDARDVLPTLPADSVHTVITSPPYYGLRDYGTAQWEGGDAACGHKADIGARASSGLNGSLAHKDGRIFTPYRDTCGKCGARRIDRQIGLEATPEAYLATMVQVFREIKRVLRPDGTVWCNIGDSFSGGNNVGWRPGNPDKNGGNSNRDGVGAVPGLAAKQLLMMPARLALALQADGWWVRSAIVWAKPNPMPESVSDRPTSAYEMVYLLTRSSRYFYDADAVREASEPGTLERADYGPHRGNKMLQRIDLGMHSEATTLGGYPTTRNLRNVWTLATHAFPEAHFATYPPELVERCVKAGTSEKGCCAACGKPWVRVTQATGGITGKSWHDHSADATKGNAGVWVGQPAAEPYRRTTTGWYPSCKCRVLCVECKGTGYAEPASTFTFDNDCPVCKGDGWVAPSPVPCTVLDPFLGSGTTALVADRLQRHAIGIDLSLTYAEMAQRRIEMDCPLFTSWAPAEDPEEARMGDLFAEAAE